MYTWRTTSTPATTAPNTTRVTIVPRAALTVAAVMAALILTVSSAIAATHTSHGWTYDTTTGVVTASADAWHKPSAEGDITITLWRRDTHGGPQVRLHRVTIPSEVPVTVALGVLPADACGGQWDVRASDGTWLAGQQWQLPGCGATTTTTTTSSSTTTDPTWTSTTTAPTTTSTTSSGTSSTSTAATTTAGATGSTRPPTMSARPTGGAPLPVAGADLRLGLLGLGLVALGIAAVAVSRRTGRYAR